MSDQFLIATSDASGDKSTDTISELLRLARNLLDMDIVFVGEFIEDRRIIRHVDVAETSPAAMKVNQSNLLEETYCQRVIDGRLPLVVPDTHSLRECRDLNVTKIFRIRSYLAVPIVFSDGRVFGTLCCISHELRSSLGNKQVDALRSIAVLVSAELEKNLLVTRSL